MNSIFGWGYPPGCTSVPGDEVEICELCAHDTDDCECPECPVCGNVGNKRCFTAENPHMILDEHTLERMNKGLDWWDRREEEDTFAMCEEEL